MRQTRETSVRTQSDNGCFRIEIARGQKRNALDGPTILAMAAAIEAAEAARARLILLSGEGGDFCAGADLAWMEKMAEADHDANLADAENLARMLRRLRNTPIPTIARVQGQTYGGGLGLICCCDLAVAADNSVFCFSEVRLGLIPATISPHVVDAVGARLARKWFLTGELIDAETACASGLVQELAAPAELDGRIDKIIELVRAGGPDAQGRIKSLIDFLLSSGDRENPDRETARLIADARASDEGREGIRAFLEKRPPSWRPSPEKER